MVAESKTLRALATLVTLEIDLVVVRRGGMARPFRGTVFLPNQAVRWRSARPIRRRLTFESRPAHIAGAHVRGAGIDKPISAHQSLPESDLCTPARRDLA